MEGKKPAWLWALVGTSLAAAFLVLLHLVDDLSQEGTGAFNQVVIGVTAGLLALVWLLAITLSLRQERAGYAVVLVLGILGAYLALDHAAGLSPSIAAVAEASGVFFVWVLLGVGTTSILAILLAGYGLAQGWFGRSQEA